MKKIYGRPSARAEAFATNETVSACLTVTLTCAIPGHKYVGDWPFESDNGAHYIGDGTATRTYDGVDHGLCGNPSTSFINDVTSSGYETINNVAQHNRPIKNVLFGGSASNDSYVAYQNGISKTVSAPGTYFASWDSTDGAQNTGTYHHYGIANVTYINTSHPNNS